MFISGRNCLFTFALAVAGTAAESVAAVPARSYDSARNNGSYAWPGGCASAICPVLSVSPDKTASTSAITESTAPAQLISQMLRQSGIDAGRWLARRLMQEYGLTSRQPAKHRYRATEDNNPALPNLLNRQFNPAAPNRVWCGDISFIRLQGKWCYLALVVDLYSRRIIGSALSLTADADLVCRALRHALETRARDGRVLFHSDQGVQYKSIKYRKLLWSHDVMQSMSRRRNCLDNSTMERVFRSLKSEWLPKGGYGDFRHAIRDINQWINGYYNVHRPHTKNGGLSPCLYEEKWRQFIPVS